MSMKLTNYIIDMGRVVAYYPNLKKVTNSTTASIMLCQFLYWINKTKDGWIYKDSYEIEEETGLTVYEQQSARKVLCELGILIEEYKRLDHKIAYKINEEILNTLWEEASGIESKPRFKRKETEKKEEKREEKEEEPLPVDKPVSLTDFQNPALHPEHPLHRSAVEKKGDYVDGILHYANSPGARRELIKNDIRSNMENRLHINMDNKRWERFINYVYGRQERHNESADRFIDWALMKGFDPLYWTPEKCQTMYPQAFLKEEDKIREDFVQKPPEHVEEEYADMPEHLKRKKKLY